MAFRTDAVDRDVDAGVLPNDLTAEFGNPATELSFGSIRVLPSAGAAYPLATADITWSWRAPVTRAAHAVDGGRDVPPVPNHLAAEYGDSVSESSLSCDGVLPPPPGWCAHCASSAARSAA